MLNVKECLHSEVLPSIDEALACFHNFTLCTVWFIAQLDIFTRCDLALLLNLLALDFVTHLVTVGESVVLADLAKDIGLPNLCRDERLFQLETFFFNALWDINFDVGLIVC